MLIFDTLISFGESVTSTALEEGYLSRDDFEDPPEALSKESVPLFFAGLFPGASRAAGVQPSACGLLVFDIDEAAQSAVYAAVNKLQDAKLEFICYTTYSHRPSTARVDDDDDDGDDDDGAPAGCYRIIVPLSRTVSAEEYPELNAAVARTYAIPAAPESERAKQPWYMPARNPEACETVDLYGRVIHGGAPLDVSEYLGAEILDEETADLLADLEAAVEEDERSPVEPPEGVDNAVFCQMVLEAIDVTTLDSREDWYPVILAIAHQMERDEEGIEMLNAWTYANGENEHYRLGETPRHIRSAYLSEGRTSLRPITLRTLLNRKARGSRLISVGARVIAHCMATAEDRDALETLVDRVQRDPYLGSEADRNTMAAAYVRRHREVSPEDEEEPKKAEIAKVLGGRTLGGADTLPKDERDFFYHRFVLDNDTELLVDLVDGTAHSKRMFDAIYRHRLPPNRAGERRQVFDCLTAGTYGLRMPRVVYGRRFEIEGPQIIEGEEGRLYLNDYVEGAFPRPARPFDPEDEIDAEIAERVQLHVKVLGNCDPAASDAILHWLAWTRQHPTERQDWCVALMSKHQGIGKTRFMALAKAVLGARHVNAISPQEAGEKFNEWIAAPMLLTFIEEPDSYDASPNARISVADFKSYVTEDETRVRAMHRGWTKEGRAIHTRIAITSNDLNTLGSELGERRWLGSKIMRASGPQLLEIFGEPCDSFYDRYSELLERHADRFAAYFDTLDLSGFDPRRKPATAQEIAHRETKPDVILSMLVDYAIETEGQPDITADVILRPALVEMVGSLINDDNENIARLAAYAKRTLGAMIDSELSGRGFAPVSTSQTSRPRLPFAANTRPRLAMVWVREGAGEGRGSHESEVKYVLRLLENRETPPAAEEEEVSSLFPRLVKAA